MPLTLKREIRVLIKASHGLHCDELLLLNGRVNRTETFKWQDAERSIRLMPLYRWLEEKSRQLYSDWHQGYLDRPAIS